MGILANLKNSIIRSRTLTKQWSPFYIVGRGLSGSNVKYSPEQALLNSDVFAVVNRVSSDIASCGISLQGYQDLINRPFGNVMTRYSFIQSIVIQMMIRGNAYVLIHRDQKSGNITSLEPLTDDQVTVQVNDAGNDLTYTVSFPDADRQSPVNVSSSDMLHFKLVQTGESATQFMGVSPLDSLTKELNLQDKSNELSLASVMHSLAPTYTLTIPKGNLNAKAKETIRKSFENQTAGENAGRTIVLDQSTELGTIQQSTDISPLTANAKYIQIQVAKAFGVPAEYLNSEGDQQSSTDQIKALYESTLSIYISPIISEFENKLHVDMSFDITGITDIDHQQLVSNVANLVKSGVLSASAGQNLLVARGAYPELKGMADAIPQLPLKGGENENGND